MAYAEDYSPNELLVATAAGSYAMENWDLSGSVRQAAPLRWQ